MHLGDRRKKVSDCPCEATTEALYEKSTMERHTTVYYSALDAAPLRTRTSIGSTALCSDSASHSNRMASMCRRKSWTDVMCPGQILVESLRPLHELDDFTIARGHFTPEGSLQGNCPGGSTT